MCVISTGDEYTFTLQNEMPQNDNWFTLNLYDIIYDMTCENVHIHTVLENILDNMGRSKAWIFVRSYNNISFVYLAQYIDRQTGIWYPCYGEGVSIWCI